MSDIKTLSNRKLLEDARATHKARLAEIGGCMDRFCFVTGPRTGQVTNGGCRCYQNQVKMQQVGHANAELFAVIDTTLARVEAALAETEEVKVERSGDTKLLDGIMAWVPDSLLLGSNDTTIFHRQEKDGAVRIEFPEEPWFSRVKDNMMVVLLKARSVRNGSENP